MKTRTIALTMALCFVAAAGCLASDVNIGTWKLNEAKSKFAPGATKNQTVVYQAVGDQMKVTIEGTTADGKSLHIDWTGKFDGKFYPLTGDPNNDERSYKKIDARTLEGTSRKAGKVTSNTRIVVAADGKSRTVTSSGTNAKGQKVTTVAVYDKE
ncbi:MAG: hypothetical protein ABSC64_11935 [Candidatus Korobacteraceae bacterium]|jgi:hypothetical protein